MFALRSLVVLSVPVLAAACAISPPAVDHAAHHAEAGASAPMAAMEPRMKAMHEMHDKMMKARSAEERSALMAEHMKAMRGGMAMLKGQGDKGMPADMSPQHKAMEQRMETMRMMMEMMLDRLPASPTKP